MQELSHHTILNSLRSISSFILTNKMPSYRTSDNLKEIPLELLKTLSLSLQIGHALASNKETPIAALLEFFDSLTEYLHEEHSEENLLIDFFDLSKTTDYFKYANIFPTEVDVYDITSEFELRMLYSLYGVGFYNIIYPNDEYTNNPDEAPELSDGELSEISFNLFCSNLYISSYFFYSDELDFLVDSGIDTTTLEELLYSIATLDNSTLLGDSMLKILPGNSYFYQCDNKYTLMLTSSYEAGVSKFITDYEIRHTLNGLIEARDNYFNN